MSMVVRKSILVEVPRAHAFEVFTARFGAWWPMASHHIGAADPETVVLEPHPGGRWFEKGLDGSECDWGRVLVWDPPERIVLGWEIGSDWKHDASLQTEVEVRFVAEGPTSTRVLLEHRNLERFGDKAEAMRIGFDSPQGWGSLLESFAAFAARAR